MFHGIVPATKKHIACSSFLLVRCMLRLIWIMLLLMEEILLTSWYGKYPIIYMVLYIPGGTGFFPSTVRIESCEASVWEIHKKTAGFEYNSWRCLIVPTCSLSIGHRRRTFANAPMPLPCVPHEMNSLQPFACPLVFLPTKRKEIYTSWWFQKY